MSWLRYLNPFREPDVYIGGRDNPYLKRWYVIPRNKRFNVYLHNMVRDDEDRALHDHPWPSLSVCLRGKLIEEMPGKVFRTIRPGRIVYRHAEFAHRLIVPTGSAWTLFMTGRTVRQWGFICPKGWVHWRDFTSGPNGETVGRGCD